MTELEIAKKYGVPTSEMCKELDWKDKTNYFFCVSYYGTFCYHTRKEVEMLCDEYGEGYVKIVCPAPQMHEIAALLPEIKMTDKTFYIKSDGLFFESIEDNHFAEALAKLYIKYKKHIS